MSLGLILVLVIMVATVIRKGIFLTEGQELEERAKQLMAAICDHAQPTGQRRVGRDEVAPSVGIGSPIVNLTEEAREFRYIAQILEDAGYITGMTYYEIMHITDAGTRACETGTF